ncbi:alpha/beta hydrolase [Vibrio harveyi]|nr:alpha/beta hydrolase [Vibrio harveyi]
MKKQTLTMIILIALTGCGIEGQSHSSTPANAPNLFVSQCGDQLFPDEPSLSFAVKGDVAELQGVVCKGSPAAFERMMKKHPEIKLLKFISIDGSADDDANLELAYQVRASHLDSYIAADGEIASGGTDLFVAGVNRTIESGATIGVHSWGAGDDVATDFPVGHEYHQLYIDYYRKMGLSDPEGFYYFTINAASADNIYNMNEREITLYGLGKITSSTSN